MLIFVGLKSCGYSKFSGYSECVGKQILWVPVLSFGVFEKNYGYSISGYSNLWILKKYMDTLNLWAIKNVGTQNCGYLECVVTLRNCGFSKLWGRCVVSLSKRHLLPKSTGNTQE